MSCLMRCDGGTPFACRRPPDQRLPDPLPVLPRRLSPVSPLVPIGALLLRLVSRTERESELLPGVVAEDPVPPVPLVLPVPGVLLVPG